MTCNVSKHGFCEISSVLYTYVCIIPVLQAWCYLNCKCTIQLCSHINHCDDIAWFAPDDRKGSLANGQSEAL